MVSRRTLILGAATAAATSPLRAAAQGSGTVPTLAQRRIEGRDEPILDPDLPIIDAHHHLFDRPAIRYMFEEYLADARAGHRIVASVYVETEAFRRPQGPPLLRPLGEVEFANGMGAMGASGVYPCRVAEGIVCYADLRAGDAIGDMLDQARALAPSRLRGVRQLVQDSESEAPYRYITNRPPRGLLKDAGFRRGLRQLARRGLSFDTAIYHTQVDDLLPVIDEIGDLRFVLNHAGMMLGLDLDAGGRRAAFVAWRRGMRELARRPNVTCKVGGFGLPFWGFGFEQRADQIGYRELAEAWRPFVEETLASFGADRCMMESNYPADARSAGFVPLWNALKYAARACSPAEKRALFHDTAARVYRLNLPDRPPPR